MPPLHAVLLLTDPPIGEDFSVGLGTNRRLCRILSMPFQSGYVDFCPCEDVEFGQLPAAATTGPSRRSSLDDICCYLQHSPLGTSVRLADVGYSAFLLRRIVASNWLLLFEYFKCFLGKMETGLSERGELVGTEWLEQGWSEIHNWRRRCFEFREHIDTTLQNLSIPISGQYCPRRDGQDEDGEDFLYIYRRMQDLKERTEALSASLTSLISIQESKQSLREAQSVKTLTTLGLVFVPLAFTSGMFSMSGSFQPGQEHFWVYFVVAIPLVVFVFAVVLGVRSWNRHDARARRLLRVGLSMGDGTA